MQSNKSQMKHSTFTEEKCPQLIMLLLNSFKKIAVILRNLSNSPKSAFADYKKKKKSCLLRSFQ